MSTAQVMAAAAALRRFSLDEIASLCEEEPAEIAGILRSIGTVVAPDDPAGQHHRGPRYRVVDLPELRLMLRQRTQTDPGGEVPTRAVVGHEDDRIDGTRAGARLQHAEESLLRCGAEPSPARRRIQVTTAVNHIKQVLARHLPGHPPWWQIEIAGDQLERQLREHADPIVSARLQLGVAVARLAVSNVAGITVPTGELIERVAGFRRDASKVDDQRVKVAVRGFVDLVTAQLATDAAPAVDRLVVTLARRRLGATAHDDAGSAMQALEPLVRSLGSPTDRRAGCGLHRTIEQLPDGRDRVLVYADLLHILPAQFRWQKHRESLPGTLVEVVTEPAASAHLSNCARALENDLAQSPFHSDQSLIGLAAHVFQVLAQRDAELDGGVLARGDRTSSELMDLARAPVWPPPDLAAPEAGR